MMRYITYVLGAIAGFFTFGGIGLIMRGYQVEGGITASFFNFRDSLSLWDFFIGSVYTGVLLFLIYLLSKDIQDPEVI